MASEGRRGTARGPFHCLSFFCSNEPLTPPPPHPRALSCTWHLVAGCPCPVSYSRQTQAASCLQDLIPFLVTQQLSWLTHPSRQRPPSQHHPMAWVLRACDVLGDQDLAHGGARPRPSGGGRQLGAHSCFLGPTLRLLARRGSFKGVGSGGGETGSKGGPRKIILPLGLSACPEASGQGREAWPGSPKEELRSPLLSDLPQGPRTLVCESALLAVAPAQTPAQAGQDHSAHTPLQPCGVSHLLSPSRSPPPSLGVAWALPSLCPLCLDERPYIAFLENVRAHA